jgi:hypothetical protein
MLRRRAAIALPLLAVLLPGIAPADSSVTRERTVTKLAEGVYAIRHPDAPDTFPQGNTTVVIVLVVDSGYLPSSARDPDNQQYFDESIAGLIQDAFNQAPK